MPQDWFAQNSPQSDAGKDWFAANAAPAPQPEGAVSRFVSHATGVPIQDIRNNPRKYLPWTKEYWQAARDQANQPAVPTDMKPGGQLQRDLEAHDLAGAAGDLAPLAAVATPFIRAGAPAGSAVVRGIVKGVNTALGKAPGAIGAAIGEVAGRAVGAPYVGGAIGYGVGKEVLPQLRIPGARFGLKAPADIAQPLTPVEAAEGASWREPENAEPAQPVQQPQTPANSQYPEGIQKAPRDRPEILSDKAARERAAQDLGMQLYRAKREIGEESAPIPKWQQVAQTKADQIRADAETEAQRVLTDAEKAATTPKVQTKTVVSKAPAAQPLDLNDPKTLADLMQRSIDLLRKKGK